LKSLKKETLLECSWNKSLEKKIVPVRNPRWFSGLFKNFGVLMPGKCLKSSNGEIKVFMSSQKSHI
jgi:hypothetical protein